VNAHTRTAPDRSHAGQPAFVLELRDVRHRFSSERGTVDVLDGLSFGVAPGEFVAVMGPSGCGKSTIVDMVAGFSRPLVGAVLHHGEPITRPDWRRGVVFQSPALYPWLSVQSNVLFGPRVRSRMTGAERQARTLLAEVGLDGFEQHFPYELSGGMRHRVALARTLMNEPELLLMDEPFAALDSQTRETMQGLLLDIWQRHRSTVLFVTHDIEEGLLLADRVVVLSQRPASIMAIIDVNIPRPRQYSTVLEPEFIELRARVRNLLHATPTPTTPDHGGSRP
jgi:NitT/TauT family transport system ATP-binding protein